MHNVAPMSCRYHLNCSLSYDIGPGYRINFGRVGERLIILLCGGDKRGQRGDIKSAKQYWADYSKQTGTQ